jgi:hypothetical protein
MRGYEIYTYFKWGSHIYLCTFYGCNETLANGTLEYELLHVLLIIVLHTKFALILQCAAWLIVDCILPNSNQCWTVLLGVPGYPVGCQSDSHLENQLFSHLGIIRIRPEVLIQVRTDSWEQGLGSAIDLAWFSIFWSTSIDENP